MLDDAVYVPIGVKKYMAARMQEAVNEVVYQAALQVIQAIDARLEAGYHYRAADGRLLTTLDEVIRALLDGGLKVADGRKVADG